MDVLSITRPDIPSDLHPLISSYIEVPDLTNKPFTRIEIASLLSVVKIFSVVSFLDGRCRVGCGRKLDGPVYPPVFSCSLSMVECGDGRDRDDHGGLEWKMPADRIAEKWNLFTLTANAEAQDLLDISCIFWVLEWRLIILRIPNHKGIAKQTTLAFLDDLCRHHLRNPVALRAYLLSSAVAMGLTAEQRGTGREVSNNQLLQLIHKEVHKL